LHDKINENGGGNGYNIPHMNKDGLEAAGMLPNSLSVDHNLYHVLQQLVAP
jgi:hypothetical protein